MNIVYMGTPEFSVTALSALVKAGHDIRAVVTQPDRMRGRGKAVSESPVSRVAGKLGIVNILKPERIKADEEVIRSLKALDADVFVVCAYGQILSSEILDIPVSGCINIHASLLPEYRGAAPIERSIMDGKTVTGISIMRMEKGLDTGPVYASESMEIKPDDTGETLRERLSLLGADLMVRCLPGIVDGSLRPEPQDDRASTYAHMIGKEDCRIDWKKSAGGIERLVRALSPRPGAYSTLNDKVLKIRKASVSEASQGSAPYPAPGSVVDTSSGAFSVICGDGTVLNIERLQLEGRKEMDAADFLRGFRMEKETMLI